MLDPAIEAFFTERKESWLKKNIKASMNEIEQREKHIECEQVFALENWLPNAAKRAGQISISTHPCTYSHPSARKNKNGYVSSVIAKADRKSDGFFRSGNLDVEPDALGNAAALDVYKFLTLTMADQQSLLSHIEQESALAAKLLDIETESYSQLRSGLLKMVEADTNTITSSKIKQVYFPVNDDYHLLSVLTNSGHMYEQRKRIDQIRFSEQTKECRELKKANKYSSKTYGELYGLTTIGYGGTKPQNISVLNNQNAGKAHLLLSAPPTVKERNVRLPKKSLFAESISPWQSSEIFHAFHKVLKTDYNNIKIREGRDYRIQEYVNFVVGKAWAIRQWLAENETELSPSLPKHQQIWVSPEFVAEREHSDEWLDKVIEDIVHSFFKGYEKVLAKKKVELSDSELSQVRKVVLANKEAFR